MLKKKNITKLCEDDFKNFILTEVEKIKLFKNYENNHTYIIKLTAINSLILDFLMNHTKLDDNIIISDLLTLTFIELTYFFDDYQNKLDFNTNLLNYDKDLIDKTVSSFLDTLLSKDIVKNIYEYEANQNFVRNDSSYDYSKKNFKFSKKIIYDVYTKYIDSIKQKNLEKYILDIKKDIDDLFSE